MIEESRGQLQDDDDDGKEDEPVDPIISVRWQGRKLPEAGYQRLHFFPAQSKAKTVSDVYGEWWKRYAPRLPKHTTVYDGLPS